MNETRVIEDLNYTGSLIFAWKVGGDQSVRGYRVTRMSLPALL